MQTIFNYIRKTRENLLQLANQFSVEALNSVPPGFNNNLIWNIGHLAVSTPALCYLRTETDKNKEIPFLSLFTKGTKPQEALNTTVIESVKENLLRSINELQQDYQNGLFTTVKPFTTHTYGLTMYTIEEVITCSLAHDNYHYGVVTAIKTQLK